MKRKSNDKRLAIARYMPPLKRRPSPEVPYTYENDQVLRWLSKNPELLGFLFTKIVDSGCIKYDPNTGEWVGVSYEA